MEKNAKTIAPIPEPKALARAVQPHTPPRVMPLEKAKKLIRKTSVEHDVLFRRLAK